MKIVLPARGLNIKRYPQGHLYQGFGENIELYRNAIKIDGCGLSDCRMNGHNGCDFAMPEGTDVLATAGMVIDVKDTPAGYGKHVRILTDPDEDGMFLELTYGHLKDIYTVLGMRVRDEQVIGNMGNTGFIVSGSTPYWGNAPTGKGVHLHITARICSTKPTNWKSVSMTGREYFIVDYDNGVFGAIDPIPMIQEWLDERYRGINITIREILVILKQLLKKLSGG